MSKFDEILRLAIDEGFISSRLTKKVEKNKPDWILKPDGLVYSIDAFLRKVSIWIVRKTTKVDNDTLFITTTRNTYYCNPRAIVECIISEKIRKRIFWSFPSYTYNPADFPDQVTVIPGFSYDYYKSISSSKFLIDNSIESRIMGYRKKKNQLLIETWHGSYGFKRFDKYIDPEWIKVAKKFARQTDYCISNSRLETEIFKKTFWERSDILEIGQPSNDVLLKMPEKEDQQLRVIREKLNIPLGCKLLLYAPTYRDDSEFLPQVDYQALIDTLEKHFGGEWIILIRNHYEYFKNHQNKEEGTSPVYVRDVTDLGDIRELLLLADVGITDYSSWLCNYILLRRPAFIYAPDLNDYSSKRGFYSPIESFPATISVSFSELLSAIMEYKQEEFEMRIDQYLEDIGYIESDHSSQTLVELMEK